jgi:hypothetical protein
VIVDLPGVGVPKNGDSSFAREHHPAGADKQKEMVELAAAGLFPPQAQDQIDDDFREGL